MTTNLYPPFSELLSVTSRLKERLLKEVTTTYNTTTLSPESIYRAFLEFQATLNSFEKQRFNGRLERGLAIAKSGGVTPTSSSEEGENGHLFKVKSSMPFNPPYLVDLDARTCTCPDAAKGYFCKHRVAANIVERAMASVKEDGQAPGHPTGTDASSASASEVFPLTPATSKESIVWGVIRLNGEILGVEILSIEGDQAKVRALPKIIDGKKLQPQFPFEGKLSTTLVSKKEIFHCKIFQ